MAKIRLDDLLIARGHFAAREQAARACIAGIIRSNGMVLSKPGILVDAELPIELIGLRRYVSRGGEKLAGALEDFALSVEGLHCIDIGASTGGFTDCLLQRGVASVAAVDVGYGQLAWQIRNDERVAVFERTNIRNADPEVLGAPFDLAVVDVSFMTVRNILIQIERLLASGGNVIALIKPQFELPPEDVGRGGVISEPRLHVKALELVLGNLRGTTLAAHGLTYSRIKGAEGNIEFLLWAQKTGICATIAIEEVVRQAHGQLDG